MPSKKDPNYWRDRSRRRSSKSCGRSSSSPSRTPASTSTGSEALENERALTETLRGYVEKRDVLLRMYEDSNAILKARAAGLAAEVQELRAHPVVKTVPRAREKLPDDRPWTDAWTLRIGDKETGTSCTVHLAGYADGCLGEVFLRFGKKERGSHGASMADLACQYLSILLQYLHPLAVVDAKQYALELKPMLGKMIDAVDDSGGWTRRRTINADGSEAWGPDPEVHHCSSLRDYLGRKLFARFCAASAAQSTTEAGGKAA